MSSPSNGAPTPRTLWYGLNSMSVVHGITALALLLVMVAIFTKRQLARIRNNSVRGPVSTVSSVTTEPLLVTAATVLRACRASLTDCHSMMAHKDAPHLARMIAVSEMHAALESAMRRATRTTREDDELAPLNCLSQLRRYDERLTELDVYRLVELYETARYGNDGPFDEKDLEEMRTLLDRFLRVAQAKLADEAEEAARRRI